MKRIIHILYGEMDSKEVMESSDERVKWLEAHVIASLKPRAEELKQLFGHEESRYVKKIMPKLRPLKWSPLGSVTCPCPFPVTQPGSLAHVIHD